jgi:hypothetical protein
MLGWKICDVLRFLSSGHLQKKIVDGWDILIVDVLIAANIIRLWTIAITRCVVGTVIVRDACHLRIRIRQVFATCAHIVRYHTVFAKTGNAARLRSKDYTSLRFEVGCSLGLSTRPTFVHNKNGQDFLLFNKLSISRRRGSPKLLLGWWWC